MALNKETDFLEKISSEIKDTFFKLQDALRSREIQLLRQIEVLRQHYKLTESYDKCFKEVLINFDNVNDIFNSIASFGQINLNGFSYENDVFKIEDYQKPEIDHVSLYKYLEKSHTDQPNVTNNIKIDHKLKHLITEDTLDEIITEDLLSEVHKNTNIDEVSNSILECIEKDDPKLCVHIVQNTDVEAEKNTICNLNHQENRISPSKSETKEILNCDNSSNIKNTNYQSGCLICNVFVPNPNCKCNDKTIEKASTTVQSECISESDKTLSDTSHKNDAEHVFNLTDQLQKISMKQPVQVQHWMKQIISETEVEPTPNNVMEHSHLEKLHTDTT